MALRNYEERYKERLEAVLDLVDCGVFEVKEYPVYSSGASSTFFDAYFIKDVNIFYDLISEGWFVVGASDEYKNKKMSAAILIESIDELIQDQDLLEKMLFNLDLFKKL